VVALLAAGAAAKVFYPEKRKWLNFLAIIDSLCATSWVKIAIVKLANNKDKFKSAPIVPS